MSCRVVIVDDAPFVREVLSQILSSAGYEVVGEASDGDEAVRVVLEKRPQLVIMDIIMPVKSGIQATQEILSQMPDVRVVACSTEGSENFISRAIEAGCVDFVVKPFEQSQLLGTLEAAVNSKGMQRSAP